MSKYWYYVVVTNPSDDEVRYTNNNEDKMIGLNAEWAILCDSSCHDINQLHCIQLESSLFKIDHFLIAILMIKCV